MQNYKNLCMNCMKEISDENICPHCGYERKVNHDSQSIKTGSILEGKYIIGEKIHRNSEGISYIGYDIAEKSPVHIREFLPEKYCFRSDNNMDINIIDEDYKKEYFNKYLNNFLDLARSLGKLRDLASLPTVYDVFQANNTAYYISSYIRGKTLVDFVKYSGGKLNWNIAKPLFMPLLLDLNTMNKSGILHLGISPNNLIVSDEGKLRIVGFSINDIRQVNHNITEELFSGYSAPEQYISRNLLSTRTDIYGFTACLLYALTGQKLKDVSKRNSDDRLLISKNTLKNIPDYVIKAIVNGLKLSQEDRTFNFEKLRSELSPIYSNAKDNFEEDLIRKKNKKYNKLYWILPLCIVVLIIILSFLFLWWSKNKEGEIDSQNDSISEQNQISDDNLDKITVPSLKGQALEEAQKNAKSSGDYNVLSSGNTEFSESIKEGFISSQDPVAGSKVNKNSIIIVTISKGSESRRLPEIKGLTLSDASKQLTLLGLAPSKKDNYDNIIPEGCAIGYENHNPGDMVKYGEQIIIEISQGPKK